MMIAGIDLTASPKKATAVAIVNESADLKDVGSFHRDEEIAAAVARCDLVGLDAPCFLPAGRHLCCFEEDSSCSCRGKSSRMAEKALRQAGFAAYPVSPNSFARSWIRRGFTLAERLRKSGLRVIEVYPDASKKRLFGTHPGRKQSVAARKWLQSNLQCFLKGIPPAGKHLLSHDELDAVVAGLTGLFFVRGETEALGDDEEGQVILPLPKLKGD